MELFMQRFLDVLKPGGEESRLAASLDPERLPRHIAIIMDGNGRWAQRRLLPRVTGHRAGVTASLAVRPAALGRAGSARL